MHEIWHRPFQMLHDALKFLELNFSARYNAVWEPEDATRMVAGMSMYSTCANGTSKILNGLLPDDSAAKGAPSSEWLLSRIRKVKLPEIIKRCDAMLQHMAAEPVESAFDMLRKAGIPVIIAMDETLMPRYGKHKNTKHTKKSKPKDGTVHFEAYYTCRLIIKGAAAVHISIIRAVKGDKQADLVRKMLQDCIDLGIPAMLGGKRSTVLLDRGFYSVDAMSAINDAGFAFIMPAVKNGTIKDAINEHANEKRTAVSLHTVKSAEGKEFAFRLIINENPRKINSDNITDRYYVFATTLKCKRYDELLKYVPREYRKRWDIETGYRCVKSIRLKTTSLNPTTSHALFCISLVIANIWMVIRNSFKIKARRIILKEMLAYAFSDACGSVLQDAVAGKPKSGLKREPG